MRRVICMTLILTCVHVDAAQIAGSWSNRAKGSFSLELVRRGDLVCGQLTVISGDKVDASWVTGLVGAQNALVEFTSGFAEKGSRGNATIQPKDGKLKWSVVRSIEKGWILSEATVFRDRWSRGRKAHVTSWCDQHWQTIKDGRSDILDLQP
jgi:hypothetical protein